MDFFVFKFIFFIIHVGHLNIIIIAYKSVDKLRNDGRGVVVLFTLPSYEKSEDFLT